MVDSFDAGHLPSAKKPGRRRVRHSAKVNGKLNGDGDPVALLRSLATALTQRADIAAAAGLTFGGARDFYQALGYSRTLRPLDYRERYKRGDIAARIVEAFPDATWSGGAEIVEDEDPDVSTPLEEEFEALNKRLGVWQLFHRADVLAGLGHFSVMLIGAAGKLEDELPPTGSQEDILYLTPYGPDEVVVERFEEEIENPRYGLPLMYHITRRTQGTTHAAGQNFDRRVHWTRVIHVVDGLLDDRVNGTPRLEKVWNRLDDLDKVTGGGAEAFWKRAHQGYHWDLKPDVKIGDAEIAKLKEEAEEFEHGYRRTIATRGMTLNAMGSDVANFDNPVRALISLISGATKIPQRILLGSERGELASTQDRENWNDRVNARREGWGTPLVRLFVTRLMESGALPEAEEYNVRWPEIKGLTEEEKADIAVKLAGVSTAAGGPVILPEEIRDRVLGLEKLDEEQLAEFEGKEQAKKDEERAKLEAMNPNMAPKIDPKTGKPLPAPKGALPPGLPPDTKIDPKTGLPVEDDEEDEGKPKPPFIK